MAIYSLQIKQVQRSKGQSATDRAAYITNTNIHDERVDLTRSRASSHAADAVIDLGSFLPNGKPVSTGELWNAAEWAERRIDGSPARQIITALPVELSPEEQRRLATDFCEWLRAKYKIATTAAIHTEHRHNPHLHILMTTREVDDAGNFGRKTRILDDKKTRKTQTHLIRAKWETICNDALQEYGIAPISCESLAAQGIDRAPTKHQGVKRFNDQLKNLFGTEGKRVWEGLQLEQQTSNRSVRQSATNTDTGRDAITDQGNQLQPRPQPRPDAVVPSPAIGANGRGNAPVAEAHRRRRRRARADKTTTPGNNQRRSRSGGVIPVPRNQGRVGLNQRQIEQARNGSLAAVAAALNVAAHAAEVRDNLAALRNLIDIKTLRGTLRAKWRNYHDEKEIDGCRIARQGA